VNPPFVEILGHRDADKCLEQLAGADERIEIGQSENGAETT
jgi:hypothetical protein